MKKWIGLLIVLSVFIFSIKPSYARFVDKKEKTLSSVKLSSPKDDIAISVPSESVSFESTSNKISLPVSIENNSTYTFKQLDVNVDSVQMGSSNVDNWKDYYNIINLPTLSNGNLLFPSKKENISVDKYKKQFSVTITVNNKIPSDTFKFTLSLKFTSIGGAVITKNVAFSIVPKSITSNNLKLTGDQEIDFSNSTDEWLGKEWTITNNTGTALSNINISVKKASALSSAGNANWEDITNSWQQYFSITFGKNFMENGTYDKAIAAAVGSKSNFCISAKQLVDISSYRKFKLTVAVTCDDNPNLSITKDVNITPRTTGINNDLPGDLGDLGIAGYFHIFASDSVFYNGSFDSNGNIATSNLNYNGRLYSDQLINYVSNYLVLNGSIMNSSKFVVGNEISDIPNTSGSLQLIREGTSKYLDFTKELIAANTLSHTISKYPNKLTPIKNRDSYVLDTSTIPDNINICVYDINYDYNNTTKIYVNNLKKKFIIINLKVDNYENIALPTTSISSEDCPYILWNINRSDNRKIFAVRNRSDSNCYGTILMPNGSLTLNTAGTFYGNFIGQKFISNGSTQKVETKKFSLNTNIVR